MLKLINDQYITQLYPTLLHQN